MRSFVLGTFCLLACSSNQDTSAGGSRDRDDALEEGDDDTGDFTTDCECEIDSDCVRDVPEARSLVCVVEAGCGRCIECTTDAECGYPGGCSHNRCWHPPTCTEPADCRTDRSPRAGCVDGWCLTCETSDQCLESEVCYLPPMESPGDHPNVSCWPRATIGEGCLEGSCSTTCVADTDPATGTPVTYCVDRVEESCQDGSCPTYCLSLSTQVGGHNLYCLDEGITEEPNDREPGTCAPIGMCVPGFMCIDDLDCSTGYSCADFGAAGPYCSSGEACADDDDCGDEGICWFYCE